MGGFFDAYLNILNGDDDDDETLHTVNHNKGICGKRVHESKWWFTMIIIWMIVAFVELNNVR